MLWKLLTIKYWRNLSEQDSTSTNGMHATMHYSDRGHTYYNWSQIGFFWGKRESSNFTTTSYQRKCTDDPLWHILNPKMKNWKCASYSISENKMTVSLCMQAHTYMRRIYGAVWLQGTVYWGNGKPKEHSRSRAHSNSAMWAGLSKQPNEVMWAELTSNQITWCGRGKNQHSNDSVGGAKEQWTIAMWGRVQQQTYNMKCGQGWARTILTAIFTIPSLGISSWHCLLGIH